jgi:methionyl-tRNA formyltransferase
MRILFIGTGDIGVPTLCALFESSEHEVVAVVTQPDKPVGRDQKITAPPIKQAVRTNDIPILQPARIKSAEVIAELQSLRPDTIVVMAYGQILPRAVLDLPALACLNLHASLLPRWRGAAPVQAAIAAGDAETGITVMYMDEGLDTGDVLLQRKISLQPAETGASLHDRLGQLAPGALFEALDLMQRHKAPRLPQDNALATYAPKLKREAGQIDWNESAEAIERKIRAFNPWPGAFTIVKDGNDRFRNLKIHSAVVVDQTAPPGQIVYADERGIVIAASGGSLSLQEVQLEGKRRMSAIDLIRGTRLSVP